METTTFTYIHPKLGPVTHNIVSIENSATDAQSIAIIFTDDRKRKLSIQTNAQYLLRAEEKMEGYVETDNAPTKPFSATSSITAPTTAPAYVYTPPPPPVVAAAIPRKVTP